MFWRAPNRVFCSALRLAAHVEVPQPLHPRRHQARHPRRERRQHRRRIVGVPVAGHERLAEPDEAVGPEAAEERVAADAHERGVGAATTDPTTVGELDLHREMGRDPVEEGAGDGGVDRTEGRGGPEVLPGTRRPRRHVVERRTLGSCLDSFLHRSRRAGDDGETAQPEPDPLELDQGHHPPAGERMPQRAAEERRRGGVGPTGERRPEHGAMVARQRDLDAELAARPADR